MIHMMLCPGGLISRPIYQASLDNLQKPNPGNIQKGYCKKKKVLQGAKCAQRVNCYNGL